MLSVQEKEEKGGAVSAFLSTGTRRNTETSIQHYRSAVVSKQPRGGGGSKLYSYKGSSTNIDIFLEKIFVRWGGGGVDPVRLVFVCEEKNIELNLWTGTVQTWSL